MIRVLLISLTAVLLAVLAFMALETWAEILPFRAQSELQAPVTGQTRNNDHGTGAGRALNPAAWSAPASC